MPALQDVGEALVRDSEQASGACDLALRCYEGLLNQLSLEAVDFSLQLAARPRVRDHFVRRLAGRTLLNRPMRHLCSLLSHQQTFRRQRAAGGMAQPQQRFGVLCVD